MNCRDAREILNSFLDGDDNAHRIEAEEHAAMCQSCREWYESMLQVLDMVQESNETPEIELSASIMAKLPKRHPASSKEDTWRQELALGLTGMLAGALSLMLISLLLLLWLKGESAGIFMIQAIELINTLALGMVKMFDIMMSVLKTAFEPVLSFVVTSSELRTRFIVFLIIDSIILLAFYLLWRRRQKITNIVPII